MRLDRFLAEAGLGTRTEVKDLVRSGKVLVNGQTVKDSGLNVKDTDEIRLAGEKGAVVNRSAGPVWYMINKPAGTVCANSDKTAPTVIELFEKERVRDLFSVGRLDKDAEGLLLVTNDGELSHYLLSPSRHVDKKYYLRINGIPDADAGKRLAEGIEFKDFTSKPAVLDILKEDREKDSCEALVTVTEGKFHEVKRLIAAVGGEVKYLKRIAFGPLDLDPALAPGEYRELNENEIRQLYEAVGKEPLRSR